VSERPAGKDPNQPLHQALASFRHQLRRFLLVSESEANSAGLHPQQHQLLLTVAGVPDDCSPSIAYAAEALGLKHNSVVELVDRCEREGLLNRVTDLEDRRRVCLRATARGQEVLNRLSQVHMRELNSQGPRLIEALEMVLQDRSHPRPRSSRKTSEQESHD
jgi:DNA-binding MarR family transcriptional regulator